MSVDNWETSVNGYKGTYYDNKVSNNWIDLDDVLYNNHFMYGQCHLKIEFNRLVNTEITGLKYNSTTITKNLPIYPEDITFGANTNYANAEILGRPGPIAGYVSTSDVTTRINLHLHRELKIPGNVASDTNQIDELVALIQACAYPRVYQDGMYVPIVTYQFGDTVITGKQTSFSTKWSGPKIGNAYMEVTLDIAISHVPLRIEYFDDVLLHNPRQFK